MSLFSGQRMLDVMIVDDEPRSIDFICSLIDWEANGFRLAAAAGSARQALAILASSHIDIVLFDVMMPDITGDVLSGMIHSQYPGIAMAALSSYDDYDYVREVLLNGAADYVLKHRLDSGHLIALLDRLRNAIRSSESGDAVLTRERMDKFRSFIGNGDAASAQEMLRSIVSSVSDPASLPSFAVSFLDFLLSFDISTGYEIYILSNAERMVGSLGNGDCGIASEAIAHLSELSRGIGRPKSQIVSSAIKLMVNGYAMNITLDDAAGVAGTNPAYLSRVFHSETGCTFIEYLTEVRLANAFIMLKKGHNLKSVAFDCGFKDYGYFLKVFKKKTGLTPLEYISLLEKVKNLD